MEKFSFLLGRYYDVTYERSIKIKWNNSFDKIKEIIKHVMFCRSTEFYYIFWTGSEYKRIKKALVISAIEN